MTGLSLPQFSLTPMFAEVSGKAVSLLADQGFLSFLTNSCFVAALVLGLLLWFSRKATVNMQLVPHGAQNAFEFLVEFLHERLEGIVGPKVAGRAFPLLATLFCFILVSNLTGILPGVGTVGLGHGHGFLSLDHVTRPFLRPATADLNMTLGMALTFMVIWWYITVREVGVWGFLVHTFGPKGGLKGIMGAVLAVIFFIVGIIEIVSIVFRPVSLSLRLYGNIFAGETLLHKMMSMADGAHPAVAFIASLLLPLPFYFMELLVGVLQAVVFTLLCSVYIKLSTAHDDEGGGHH